MTNPRWRVGITRDILDSGGEPAFGRAALAALDKADAIEVVESAQRRYNDALQRRLRRAGWSEGGCRSWYLDADGVNRTLWPGFTFEYWARTRRARPSDYAMLR